MQRCARAAIELSLDNKAEYSPGVMALIDIKGLFDASLDTDRIRSQEIVDSLLDIEDRPWSGYKENPNDSRLMSLNAKRLAAFLSKYHIAPRNHRMPDGIHKKGYKKSYFAEAWSRYLPSSRFAGNKSPTPHDTAINNVNGNDRIKATQEQMLTDAQSGSSPSPTGVEDVVNASTANVQDTASDDQGTYNPASGLWELQI